MRILRLLSCVWHVAFIGTAVLGADDNSTGWSKEQIVSAVEQAKSKITNLQYVAECEGIHDLNVDDQIRKYWVNVAFEGDFRFAEIAHYRNGRPRNCDTDWTQNILVRDRLTVFWPLTRKLQTSTYTTVKDNPKVGPILCETLMKATGWWPVGSSIPEEFKGYVLTELLKSDCRLKATTWNGHHCILVESSDQAVWLSSDMSYAILRRSIRMSEDVLWWAENSDFQELAEGFWLPRKFETSIVDVSSENKRIFSRDLRHVQSYKVNVSLSSLWDFQPLPGTLVYHFDDKRVEALPGGVDLLDQLADYMRETTPIANHNKGTASETNLTASALFVLLGMLLGYSFYTGAFSRSLQFSNSQVREPHLGLTSNEKHSNR